MALLAILLASCELLSLAFTKLHPDIFDWRETLLSLMRAEDFERFKQQFASETLGWDNPTDQNRFAHLAQSRPESNNRFKSC